MTELWERWFGEEVQGITGGLEAKTHINVAYDTLNYVQVPKKPFSKNLSSRNWLIAALCFKDSVPEFGDKG